MHRFLPAVLLIQLISMAVLWVNMESSVTWTTSLVLKITLPLALVAIVAALWFDSIGRQRASQSILKIQESHAKDREKLQVQTEKEKTKILKDAHKEISKQSRRVSNRANLKVGLAFLGAAGAGLVMLITELVTFGMMTLMTAGGALGGYLTRAKQERTQDNVETPVDDSRPPRMLNQTPAGTENNQGTSD